MVANLFTHLDQNGEARMVDISQKISNLRVAQAEAFIEMNAETFHMIMSGQHKKGDVLAAARIAGIMASKKTAELIPLCHSLSLSFSEIELTPDPLQHQIRIRSTCQVMGQTGVEMEALVAASTAALTLYDMCKSVQKDMVISQLRLLHKSGGKSGTFEGNGV